jgi:hypothetical protein
MSEIDGGINCIYHYAGAVFLGVLTAVWYFGNSNSIRQCWNNSHPE